MTRLPIVLAVAACACAGTLAGLSPVEAATASPCPPGTRFTPAAGFSGDSRGEGKFRMVLGRERAFHVESHGAEQADGAFRLDQTVTFAGEPSRTRTWLIRTVAPDRYAATLSDAAGPVRGETVGRTLLLDYRLKGPLYMHQTLVLGRDGRTIDNQSEITLLGLPVGHLHETITPRA